MGTKKNYFKIYENIREPLLSPIITELDDDDEKNLSSFINSSNWFKPHSPEYYESTFSLDEETKNLEQKLTEFELQAKELTISHLEDKVKNHCDHLLDLIENVADDKIEQINSINDKILDKINEYEFKSLESYLNDYKNQLKETIDKTNSFIAKQKRHLNQLDKNEKILSNEQIIKLKQELEEKKFENNLIQFEMNEAVLDEKILGEFSSKVLNLSISVTKKSNYKTLNF